MRSALEDAGVTGEGLGAFAITARAGADLPLAPTPGAEGLPMVVVLAGAGFGGLLLVGLIAYLCTRRAPAKYDSLRCVYDCHSLRCVVRVCLSPRCSVP